MQERQAKILTYIAREYIRRTQPVSSELLAKRYDLGVSPATIRNEFLRLTEEGYLTKPHTSAGRIPTNRGWRFYVEETVMGEPVPSLPVRKPESFEALADILSELSGLLGVSMREDGDIFLSGLADLFSQPDFETKAHFAHLAETVDTLETENEAMCAKLVDSPPNVFIGRENPYFTNDDISTIFSGFKTDDGVKGVAFIIGAKRMPYERSWHVIRNLEKLLHQTTLQ